jgi:hypothetical protein
LIGRSLRRSKPHGLREKVLDAGDSFAPIPAAKPRVLPPGAEKRKFIVIVMGSSPKFCPAAEDHSDLCLAFTETMDGGQAAAHCIFEEAGGVAGLDDNFMKYNQPLTRNSGILLMGLLRQFGLTRRPERELLRVDQVNPTKRQCGLLLI